MAKYRQIGANNYKVVPTELALRGMNLDEGIGSLMVQHGLKEVDETLTPTGATAPAALAPQEQQYDIASEEFSVEVGGVLLTKEMVLAWFAAWYDARA